MKRTIKRLWQWLCKIGWGLGKGSALTECPWYCEEARKEILGWGNKKEGK